MHIALKSNVDVEDMIDISPWLMIVFGEFYAYATKYSLPVIITSILDDAPGRVSSTHAEGRAIDVSDTGWTRLHIQRVMYHLNLKYAALCGTSKKGGKPYVIIYHNSGTGLHFHIQVRRFAYIDFEFEDDI